MNHIYDLRLPEKQHARKTPFIFQKCNYPDLEVWEEWNMLLKYGAENQIIKELLE